MKKSLVKLITLLLVAFAALFTACANDYDPLEDVLIASVIIKTPATQTEFAVGEAFNADGLELEATYVNGQKRVVDADGYTIDSSAFNSAAEGFYDIGIVLNANGERLEYMVKVGSPAITPLSISVSALPTKTRYFVGEAFTSAGLAISAKNNDKSVSVVAAGDYTIDSAAFDPDVVGTYKIDVALVSDLSITTFFTVRVEKEVSAISVRVAAEDEFFIGSAFSFSGLVVQAHFIDSTKSDIAASTYTVDSSDFEAKKNTAGATATITITLKENTAVTTSYTVRVFGASGITLASLPYRTVYAIGESAISISGLSVKAAYGTKGRTQTLTSVSVNTSAYNGSAIGVYPISVSYGGFSASFDVKVETVSSINVLYSPRKTQYYTGEAFDGYGLSIGAVFADGTSAAIGSQAYTVDASAMAAAAGPYNVVVRLTSNPSVTTSFLVSVFTADSIQISASSTHKTDFAYAETFESYGLVVEAVYGGAAMLTVPIAYSAYSVDYSAFKRISAGSYQIKVSLNSDPSKVCFYTATVAPRLPDELLFIERDYNCSAETVFAYGEDFSSNGLIVIGSSTDHETKGAVNKRVLSPLEYTVDSSAYDAFTAGSYLITVTFNANPALRFEYKVTVAAAGKYVIQYRSRHSEYKYMAQPSVACELTDVIGDYISGNYRPTYYNGYTLRDYYIDSNYSTPVVATNTVGDYSAFIEGNRLTLYIGLDINSNNASSYQFSVYDYPITHYLGVGAGCQYSEDIFFNDYFTFLVNDSGLYSFAGVGIALYSGGIAGYVPVRVFEYSGDPSAPFGSEVVGFDGDGIYQGYNLTAGRYVVAVVGRLFGTISINKAVSVNIYLSTDVQTEISNAGPIAAVLTMGVAIDTTILDLFGKAAEDLGGRFELYEYTPISDTVGSVINYNALVSNTVLNYYMDFVM